MQDLNAVGPVIRKLRQERGWTQTMLAVKSGASIATISKIERGGRRPSADTLGRIAEALDVEVSRLFLPGSMTRGEGLVWGSDALVGGSEGKVRVGRAELSAALHAVETGLMTADAAAEKLLQ